MKNNLEKQAFGEPITEGWQASLVLECARKNNKTIVSHQLHQGPLRIQRPFYPENDGTCHIYLLHPPGGVVAGDGLKIDITLHENSRTLITTPGATKYYRSSGLHAKQIQTLILEKNTCLEWLPQETIVFNEADLLLTTKVYLVPDAIFMGWEILCLGRPASNEFFIQGNCRQQFEIWHDDQPIWIDRTQFPSWGMHSYTVLATFIVCLESVELIDSIRSSVMIENQDALFSVTQCNAVIVCRYLGHSAQHARQVLTQAWKQARLYTMNKEPTIPRIWHT